MFENEIAVLNQKVDEAINKRKAFLDSKMSEVAKVKIGEEIYNLETGQLLGVVTELYRYWDNRNERYVGMPLLFIIRGCYEWLG